MLLPVELLDGIPVFLGEVDLGYGNEIANLNFTVDDHLAQVNPGSQIHLLYGAIVLSQHKPDNLVKLERGITVRHQITLQGKVTAIKLDEFTLVNNSGVIYTKSGAKVENMANLRMLLKNQQLGFTLSPTQQLDDTLDQNRSIGGTQEGGGDKIVKIVLSVDVTPILHNRGFGCLRHRRLRGEIIMGQDTRGNLLCSLGGNIVVHTNGRCVVFIAVADIIVVRRCSTLDEKCGILIRLRELPCAPVIQIDADCTVDIINLRLSGQTRNCHCRTGVTPVNTIRLLAKVN